MSRYDIGGWKEYHRLVEAGVNDHSARILAGIAQSCGNERAYWRHLYFGVPPDPACRRAHAISQRRRRVS